MNNLSPSEPSGGSALRLWGLLIALFAFWSGLYLLNPLGTADDSIVGRLFGFRLLQQRSASMEPTLHRSEYIVVSAWPYATSEPKAGDIIVFRFPPGPDVLYSKRIIALPGDTIAVVDGTAIVNGVPLPEPYLRNMPEPDPRFPPVPDFDSWQVPAESYFVLGDSRENSSDSRVWGAVHEDLIVGKVMGVSEAN